MGNLLNKVLRPFDLRIVPASILYEWQINERWEGSYTTEIPLPDGAESYLHPTNPRLLELEQKYSEFHKEVTTPLVWNKGHVKTTDLLYFRGDNAYVWQLRGWNMNAMAYALSAYYLKSVDELKLFESLHEDGLFGVHSFKVDGRKISRDLLDSVAEIRFLEKHCGLSSRSNIKILDIGAGYGRLAHRLLTAFPNVTTYACTDAIAASTFVCEYYLRFRNLTSRVDVIPLFDIESTLKNTKFDLAINTHSFPECNLAAIEWWVNELATNRVRQLMLVPNVTDETGDILYTSNMQDFRPILNRHGYIEKVREPKFLDPIVQDYGVDPSFHYLFELEIR